MFLDKILKKSDKSHDALVAAFCLVSYADGQLHVAELTRFMRILARDNPGMKLDEDRLVHDVISFGKHLLKDFAAGKTRALTAIAKVKDDSAIADKIMKISQIAVISDDQIVPAEETVIAEIAAALGRAQTLP